MSYILDALLKADRERHQDVPPGLNTPMPFVESVVPAWRVAVRMLLGTGIGLSLLWGILHFPPRSAVPSERVAVPAPPAPPAMPAMPLPIPVAPLPDLPPAANATAPMADGRSVVATPASPLPSKTMARAAPLAAKKPAALPGKTGDETRLYRLDELPPDLREAAQRLHLSGSALAADDVPAMAIVNDRALSAGAEIGDGMRIERIDADGVTFNLKGYRYRKENP